MSFGGRIFRYFARVPTRCTIAVGTLLVLWHVWFGVMSLNTQLVFALTSIFLTGIPHGALDHLVEKETALRTHRQYSFGRFLLKYVLLIGVYAIAWYLFSLPSLLVFLLISAWHFGETDVEKVPSKAYLWMVNRFLHGAFVLAWLLLGHAAETTPILERITQSSAEELWIWQYAVVHRWQILLNGWVLISVLTWAAQQQHPAVFDVARMLRLLLVLILCQALPLLLAFTLYFAGWHSISAFQTIQAYLTAGAKGNRWRSWWNFWILAMPFTLLAVLSSAVLAWYWQRFAQQIDPLPILFIFLSLITLPHLQVMHGMNSRVPE